jgi:hypothetical protein
VNTAFQLPSCLRNVVVSSHRIGAETPFLMIAPSLT